ncbi:Predicted kinase, aminoglycoside phosphotransferase (APT) family [Gracilibacillus orientalis]|uniref:Predicted kinase, aminoglycoside phosphotransferase (APT) family n=1 Tax=Gracilibacillus orientalis TaxID=334253 RepID=A0A1I4Q149_9BACI|nr:phosphotransferase [Gracilibacillus orientalis]SFM33724.1 Predicted kinase, aminoglycoside phosphotransferase (APT) family [Gracilibacillus orientalis]
MIESIPMVNSAKVMEKIEKGFSRDQKYILDYQYLLRIFPVEEIDKRKVEYQTLKKLAEISDFVPEPIEFGKGYMILTYLPGEDGEDALQNLTEQDQYIAGLSAGRELRKLHQLDAPQDYPSWYKVKKEKSDNYLYELKKLDLDQSLCSLLQHYIKDNEPIMKNRPNKFQHDDIHPSNLLINQKKFSGIIDFQRMDWGDPVHDLQKLGFFSVQVSIPFTNGVIDGYCREKPTQAFWELYTLYSAMHVVSALVWGKRISSVQTNLLYNYSLRVLEDHDHFSKIIPSWYGK